MLSRDTHDISATQGIRASGSKRIKASVILGVVFTVYLPGLASAVSCPITPSQFSTFNVNPTKSSLRLLISDFHSTYPQGRLDLWLCFNWFRWPNFFVMLIYRL